MSSIMSPALHREYQESEEGDADDLNLSHLDHNFNPNNTLKPPQLETMQFAKMTFSDSNE